MKEEKLRRLRSRQKPTLLEFCQRTLAFDLDSWQSDHLIPQLERLHTERGLRMLIHGPQQLGKSIIVSRRFPAWAMGMDPKRRLILSGFGITHATDSFGEPTRNLMQSELYAEMFPDPGTRIPTVCSAESFTTAARHKLNDGQASVTCLGISTAWIGKGLAPGDILIVDDPYASAEDARSIAINDRTWRWWTQDVKDRIHPEANVVIMFHRYHQADLAGRLMEKDGYTTLGR